MKIKIINRWTGSTLFETEAPDLRAAVIAAVQARANLSGADLSEADWAGLCCEIPRRLPDAPAQVVAELFNH